MEQDKTFCGNWRAIDSINFARLDGGLVLIEP